MAFKLEALEKHKDFTMWMRTEKTQGLGSLQQLCSYSPSDLHPSGQQANLIDAETIGWGTDEARRGGALQQLFCHSPRSLSRVSTQLEASGQLCPWQSPHVCLRNKLVISFPHTLLAVFFFSHKVCEIQLKSTNSCGSLEELAQAGDGLFPQGWRELSAKALWAPGMCCGKIFNYCCHLFSSFRTSLF